MVSKKWRVHIRVCSLHRGSEEGRHIWTLLLELLSLSPLSDAKWCFYEKIEFVKEWVVKNPKILFTLADIPHRSWCYVGILPKDRNFVPKVLKLISVAIGGKVKWFCLIWVIYARFAKNMVDSSQLIISLIL